MADDVMLRLQYADGELRETAAVHWAVAGLPNKPIASVWARQGRGPWMQVNAHAEYAVVPGEPLLLFALSPSRTGQVAGMRWEFFAGGRVPEVQEIDEAIGSSRLPPASAFIPGDTFRPEPEPAPGRAPWWRRVLAHDVRLWAG